MPQAALQNIVLVSVWSPCVQLVLVLALHVALHPQRPYCAVPMPACNHAPCGLPIVYHLPNHELVPGVPCRRGLLWHSCAAPLALTKMNPHFIGGDGIWPTHWYAICACLTGRNYTLAPIGGRLLAWLPTVTQSSVALPSGNHDESSTPTPTSAATLVDDSRGGDLDDHGGGMISWASTLTSTCRAPSGTSPPRALARSMRTTSSLGCELSIDTGAQCLCGCC